MPCYKTPLREMRFIYTELFDSHTIEQLPGFAEITHDLVFAMLEEAGKFCEGRLLPINQSGDEEGCRFIEGQVSTPDGFVQAYKDFCELGFSSLTAPVEYDGQGMPKTLGLMIEEIICSTNMSFSLYPGLTNGACNAIIAKGSDEIKQKYLPKMIDGSWTGAMSLTEPHCGSDLALLRTKATPNDDGSYTITGSKIFITAGDHDLSENIIHLVLARTPDAPKGIKGISMFLVPKLLVGDNSEIGQHNNVNCGSIEHKMGLKASATCSMNFDGSKGYLVGELNRGMAAMFIMMNIERLAVGIQGLGVAEASYQAAAAYAAERLQGRALTGAKYPDKPADPLLVHPDVRRMLLIQRAYNEGNRALVIWVARELDISRHHADTRRRQDAEDFIALMTPVVKAFISDIASEVANLGVQILGGHGYIREQGMEQYVRDARIAQIYEGTNGIQALDLVSRKISANDGRYLQQFYGPIQSFLESNASNHALGSYIGPLGDAFQQLQSATSYVSAQLKSKPDDSAAAATDYLRLFGLVALGYLWARMAKTANAQINGSDSMFYQAKIDTANFYFERLLPQCGALHQNIMAGSDTIMQFDDDAFLL
ncbi:MAG: acyl-CoA dehydrogenase C-terminal domain-containing protein [Gammaproteobacteria bacterium]